jgi:hypothetical protein
MTSAIVRGPLQTLYYVVSALVFGLDVNRILNVWGGITDLLGLLQVEFALSFCMSLSPCIPMFRVKEWIFELFKSSG